MTGVKQIIQFEEDWTLVNGEIIKFVTIKQTLQELEEDR